MRKWAWLAVTAIALSSIPASTPTRADPDECQEAADTYNSNLDDVQTALRRYASCVDTSAGHDDCSSEFGYLRNAQEDYERAVSDYQDDCP